MSPRERIIGDSSFSGMTGPATSLNSSLEAIAKEESLLIRKGGEGLHVSPSSSSSIPDLATKPSKGHHWPLHALDASITSETTKSTKEERFLRFAEGDALRAETETLALWQYSQEEVDATWFTEEEFFNIRRNIMMALKHQEEFGDTAQNDSSSSFRGLEIRTRVGTQARIQSIKASLHAVLEEQNSQRMNLSEHGDYIMDSDSIAAKYARTTSSHQLWAHMMGIADRKAAELCELEELLEMSEMQQEAQPIAKPPVVKRKESKRRTSKTSSAGGANDTKTKKKRKKVLQKKPKTTSTDGSESKEGETSGKTAKKKKQKGRTKKKKSSKLRRKRRVKDDESLPTVYRLGEESSIYDETCASTYYDESCASTYYEESVASLETYE